MALGGRTLAPLALALLAGAAPAQSLAGSETSALLPQALVMGGGSSASETYALESGLGQAAAGAVATSPGFALASGVAWSEPSAAFDAPLVFGTPSGRGDRLGGEPQAIFGFNLNKPGAGFTTVFFAGVPGTGTLVRSPNVVTTTSPPGMNEHENPLGASRLAISNFNGTHGEPGRFVYTPALVASTVQPRVDGELTVRFFGPDASFWLMALGFSTGTSIPFEHIGGGLEVVQSLLVLVGDGFAPNGEDRRTFPLSNPGLAGLTLELQAVALDDLVNKPYGSFGNRLEVFVNPSGP